MATSDLNDMSTSQVVDFYAFVLDTTCKDKKLVELTLANSDKPILPTNFSEESLPQVPQDARHKVLFVLGAYLVVEESGGRH